MKRSSRLALLVVASASFVVGILGAIVFFPDDENLGSQVRGANLDTSVDWQTSLIASAPLAKQNHKYVLADVYTDWCHFCKKLDKNVFCKPKVVKYLRENFICVKVNAEDRKEGVTIASKYNVTGFPCGLVFSPEGRLLGRVDGYEDADGYINTLQQITGSGK